MTKEISHVEENVVPSCASSATKRWAKHAKKETGSSRSAADAAPVLNADRWHLHMRFHMRSDKHMSGVILPVGQPAPEKQANGRFV